MNLENEAIYIKSLQLKARKLKKDLSEVEKALNEAGMTSEQLTDDEQHAKNLEIAKKMSEYFKRPDKF